MLRKDFEAGVENVTLAAGDGTSAVTFDQVFDKPPSISVGFQESLGAGKRGFVAATSVTVTGFTVDIDSDSALADVDVGWVAIERRSTEKRAQ